MPRKAREKTKEVIFHIMARSISEVDLFKNKELNCYRSGTVTRNLTQQ